MKNQQPYLKCALLPWGFYGDTSFKLLDSFHLQYKIEEQRSQRHALVRSLGCFVGTVPLWRVRLGLC